MTIRVNGNPEQHEPYIEPGIPETSEGWRELANQVAFVVLSEETVEFCFNDAVFDRWCQETATRSNGQWSAASVRELALFKAFCAMARVGSPAPLVATEGGFVSHVPLVVSGGSEG